MNNFSPTIVHRSASKSRNIDQVIDEMNGLMKSYSPPSKKMTYEVLLNNLSDSAGFKHQKMSR